MKNKITIEEVAKVANLANLNLTEAELKTYTKQLEEVIDYSVAELNKVSTEGVEPLLNVSGLTNDLRNDEVAPLLTQKEALQNSPSTHNGFFKVKRVLDQ